MLTHIDHKHFSSRPIPVLMIVTGILIALSFTIPVLGQTFYPSKDLVFTQVIASTGFESIITVTNRGTVQYEGDIYFHTGQDAAVWNPIVNGSPVEDGQQSVNLPPQRTRAYRITDSTFTVGYAYIYADDLDVNNHLEGNLTYYSKSSGNVLDAVGVPPSSEFLTASLPFYTFADVGLSLAVPLRGRTGDAEVDIILFDDGGDIYSQCTVDIIYGGHYAKFLKELPWISSISEFGNVGKVEIHSDRFVSGIGMTVTPDGAGGAQISTLPLDGTPLLYTFNGTDSDEVQFEGNMSFWISGYFVTGYMQVTSVNGVTDHSPATWKVTGQLNNGALKLTFPCYLGDQAVVPEVSLYIYVPGYTSADNNISGTFSADELTLDSVPTRGTITLNQITPTN
jgi:hypothetical protein